MVKRTGVLWLLWAAALGMAVGALLLSAHQGEAAAAVGTAPQGYVALTFDDGPWPGTTGALLDGLEERGAKATFFLIGKQVAERPNLVQRMAAEGHQIGLHTWDHVALRGLGQAEVCRQLEKSRDVLELLTGSREFMLRPPYGFVDDVVSRCAEAPIITWSVDTEDWRDEDVGRITQAVVDRVSDGDIVLMHDIFHSSVTAALDCVDKLQERGFVLVTVEELFDIRGIAPENGNVYRCLPPQ